MGDRCYCTLYLGGILQEKHASHLSKLLIDSYVEDFAGTVDEGVQELLQGTRSFSFSEVNYGEMEAQLKEGLKSLKLSYIWCNGPGENYGEGGLYYDARTDETAHFNTIDENICLTLDQINAEGILEEAKRWENFASTLRFVVCKSNHDLIAREKAGDLPEGYIDLLSDANPLET